ncbi:hypothetical protein BC940DRAFT_292750 [Gongronella butleri]|nr:hypothetical protein BC940DRAFT_292750 [Gongronella butleri]
MNKPVSGEPSVPAVPDQGDIDLIRSSWQRVLDKPVSPSGQNHAAPNGHGGGATSAAQAFGLAFYGALFDLNPSARALFGANVIKQAKMLTAVIAYIARAPMLAPPDSLRTRSMSIREINALRELQKQQLQQNEQNEQKSGENNETTEMDVGDATPELDSSWLIASLHELGARHALYRVKPTDFKDVWPAIDVAYMAEGLRDEQRAAKKKTGGTCRMQ